MSESSQTESDHYKELLGVEVVEVDENHAVCSLKITEKHCNVHGGPHGGVIFSLADIAFETAGHACGQYAYVAIQAEVRFMRKTEGDTLTATAKLISSSRRLAHYSVDVTDTAGNSVALFTGTGYRLGT